MQGVRCSDYHPQQEALLQAPREYNETDLPLSKLKSLIKDTDGFSTEDKKSKRHLLRTINSPHLLDSTNLFGMDPEEIRIKGKKQTLGLPNNVFYEGLLKRDDLPRKVVTILY